MTEHTATETQTYVSPAMKIKAREFAVDIADAYNKGNATMAERLKARRARWAANVGYPLH